MSARLTEQRLKDLDVYALSPYRAIVVEHRHERDALRAEVEALRDHKRAARLNEEDRVYARVAQEDNERLRADNERLLLHSDVTQGKSVAELTAERDALRVSLGEACHLIGGMITELARYEDDPSMLDGHRARVAEFMRKLVQA